MIIYVPQQCANLKPYYTTVQLKCKSSATSAQLQLNQRANQCTWYVQKIWITILLQLAFDVSTLRSHCNNAMKSGQLPESWLIRGMYVWTNFFQPFFYFRQNKLVSTLPSLLYILNPDNLSFHVPLTYEPNPDLVVYYTNRGVRSGARFTRTCTQAAAVRRKSSSSVS